MPNLPTIQTERLVLRPFCGADAADVQRLAGDLRVAETTLTIPHPYPDGSAEAWIATHEASWELGRGLVLAITSGPPGAGGLVGAIGLSIGGDERVAELGYWVGVPYWGRGYCTEAARALIAHAFRSLGLERIFAHHFTRNPASGRVLVKAGMRSLGVRPAAVQKWGRLEDLAEYAVTRAEWLEQARAG